MELSTISDLMDIKLNAFGGGVVKDEYEKSLYLTIAQDTFYAMLLDEFENNSSIGLKLGKLIKEDTISTSIGVTAYGGVIVDLGENVRAILRDSVEITHASVLYNNAVLAVNEERLAEIQDSLSNPFRKPTGMFKSCLRAINEEDTFKRVQLYLPAGATLKNYHVTMAIQPVPIVLEDLPTGLDISGESTATVELSFSDPEIHKIIDIAVSLILNNLGAFTAKTAEK